MDYNLQLIQMNRLETLSKECIDTWGQVRALQKAAFARIATGEVKGWHQLPNEIKEINEIREVYEFKYKQLCEYQDFIYYGTLGSLI